MSRWIFVNQSSVAWTPAELSLLAWYDADAITGLSDGDSVTTWADESGNSRDITTGVAPTYQTNELNGKSMVRFQDSSYLKRESAFMYANGACTIGAIIRDTGTQAPRFVLGEGRSTADTPIYSPMAFSGLVGNAADMKMLYRTDGNVAVISYTDIVASSVDDAVIVTIDDGSSVVTTKDGNPTVTAVASYTRATTTLDRFAIGGLWRTGFQGNVGWGGDIAEIVIAGSALGESDRQKLEGYLAHKWGLTANLPAGHPYKTTAPTT